MLIVSNKDFEKRIKSESRGIMRITNDQLVCKDCAFKYDDEKIFGNTSFCDQYPDGKPDSIIVGGECDYYEQ